MTHRWRMRARTRPLVGATVTFNGSNSYDIDDGIVLYEWNFGDGKTGMA